MGARAVFAGLLMLVMLISSLTSKEISRQPDSSHADRKRDWHAEGQRELERALNNRRNENVAKNVIIFLGDGMGVSTVTASRFYHAQTRNLPLKDAALAWETFPNVALAKTYNVDRMTADSAGTATAFLTGVKAKFGTIGVNDDAIYNNCTSIKGNQVESILDKSAIQGKWTGIVTTARVTHATPAAAYAGSPNRNWEGFIPDNIPHGDLCTDIATQLVNGNSWIRVVMGGGKQMFLPRDPTRKDFVTAPKRKDNVNLMKKWLENKRGEHLAPDEYAVLETKDDLDNVPLDRIQYMLGLFADSHMDYESDRVAQPIISQPSLTEMTEKAIRVLQRGEHGFFLLVEGGRIDHAHHRNNAYRAFNETVAMSDAVQRAMELTDESDTLIVVTADHSHVMTMGGYPTINNPILGLVNASMPIQDGKPSTTIMYANGPGFNVHRMKNGEIVPRKNLTDEDTEGVDFIQDAALPLYDETHGGEDVAIYARGPMSHLFHGVHEQNYIAHAMIHASCLDPGRRHCQPRPNCDVCAAGSRSASDIWLVYVILTAVLSFL